MRILPVIDLMGGVVVRGVAGRRAEYRPIVSRLTPSTAPLDVARAFREHFDLTELYLADLDAIAGQAPALATIEALLDDGFRLWVDAGAALPTLAGIGVQSLVAGLESLSGPAELQDLVVRFGKRLVFSLDLKDGKPLANAESWNGAEAWSIAAQACGLGSLG